MPSKELYELDQYAWLEESIKEIRSGVMPALDCIVDYLDEMTDGIKGGLDSQMTRLLAHLLKWEYQPEKRTTSWSQSIFGDRASIRSHAKNTNLKKYLATELEDNYKEGRKWAAKETKLNLNAFPTECEYSMEQLLDSDFFPGIKD